MKNSSLLLSPIISQNSSNKQTLDRSEMNIEPVNINMEVPAQAEKTTFQNDFLLSQNYSKG
jgi:hypothetical protein